MRNLAKRFIRSTRLPAPNNRGPSAYKARTAHRHLFLRRRTSITRMTKLFRTVLLAAACAVPLHAAPPAEPPAPHAVTLDEFHDRLALRWAPIHHQDVNRTGQDALGGRSDFVTAIDYDGDWDTRNNWRNLPGAPAKAVAYYSVVSTDTHWYVVYAFYHPRDWCGYVLCRLAAHHENDLEGLLAIVRRPERFAPDDFGALQGVVTVFHLDFFAYTPQGGPACPGLPASPLGHGRESVDGALTCREHGGVQRFVTAQEARGHGLKAWPHVRIKGGDGVVYLPSATESGVPRHVRGDTVPYRLVSLFAPGGVWDRRGDRRTYAGRGKLAGREGRNHRAQLPWDWNDWNDGLGVRAGEMAMDPARLARAYFSGTEFSGRYIHHPYREQRRADPAYLAWLGTLPADGETAGS